MIEMAVVGHSNVEKADDVTVNVSGECRLVWPFISIFSSRLALDLAEPAAQSCGCWLWKLDRRHQPPMNGERPSTL